LRAVEEALSDVLSLGVQARGPDPRGVIAPVNRLPLSLHGTALKGAATARIALIEFGDFQCLYCRAFADGPLREIETAFVETGRVVLGFKHYPVESLHPRAFRAAEAAVCAGQAGKFWPFHKGLLTSRGEVDESALLALGSSVGVDPQAFRACLSGNDARAQVRADKADATHFGVSSTPSFLVGELQDRTVWVVRRIRGAQPFSVFEQVIERLLDDPR
jgi:protein-disulfide isomerase